MRIESLTFFRFIAAIIVVVFHFGREATGFRGVLAAGPQMVNFFFVLSGFVMTVSYLKKEVNPRSYWWARVSRIMPVYLFAIGAMLLLGYLRGTVPDGTALLLNLLLVQAWISPYPLTVNPPGWSLSVEAFFYLLFPFIVMAVNKYRLSHRSALAAAITCWVITQAIMSIALTLKLYKGFPSTSHDLMHYLPLSHLCGFLLGVAGAIWYLETSPRIDSTIVSLVLLAGAGFAVVYCINHQLEIPRLLGFRIALASSFFAPLFLFLILAVSLSTTAIAAWLSARPLVLLGEISYSLYILQVPAWEFFSTFISVHVNATASANFSIFVLFLILASFISFFLIERPSNRLLRYALPRWFQTNGVR